MIEGSQCIAGHVLNEVARAEIGDDESFARADGVIALEFEVDGVGVRVVVVSGCVRGASSGCGSAIEGDLLSEISDGSTSGGVESAGIVVADLDVVCCGEGSACLVEAESNASGSAGGLEFD